MKKWLTLSLIGCVSFLTACGGGGGNADTNSDSGAAAGETKNEAAAPAEENVKLRVYAQYSDDDTKGYYDYAVAELKKEMPNVELELEIQAQDDGQKLKTYAATGNLPDIFNVGMDHITTFSKSGNILVLDEYVNSTGFKDKMLPSAMNTLYAPDGHVYAFPYAGNEFVLLYYNKELFEKNGVKVPTTYDELMTAVQTFKAAGVTPMSLFAKEKWPTVALYDMFATRYNPEGIVALDRGTAKPSDPGYKEAAQQIIDLVNAGLFPSGVTNLNYDQAVALFHEGKAAMFLNGQWEIEASTKALGDKVGYMYIPAPDSASYEKSKMAFSGGGNPGGFAVSPNSKHQELAVEVAQFLALKYSEHKFTQKASPIVATKVDKPIEKAFDPLMEQLSKDIPNITSTTAFAWGLTTPKFKAAIEDSAQALMTGSLSADQFITDLENALK